MNAMQIDIEKPFLVPEFSSGPELRKLREAQDVSLADIARVMEVARSYAIAIEERPCLRKCTIRRYVLALYSFVSVRKAAATQKPKTNSEQPNGTSKISHGG